ncbi:MAG: serine hydrolase [Leucobacter sp.]
MEPDPGQYRAEDILAISARTPHVFEPGTNWDYSHAGYFVLGQVLEAAGDAALDELIARCALEPLKLDSTTNSVRALSPEASSPVSPPSRASGKTPPAGTRHGPLLPASAPRSRGADPVTRWPRRSRRHRRRGGDRHRTELRQPRLAGVLECSKLDPRAAALQNACREVDT